MKKIVSLLLALVMMAGMVFTLASCGAPADSGAEIKIYLGNEMYDFDPTDYYEDSNAEQVMSLLFEPLFRYNANGGLECAAAQSYKVVPEERKIVIELRESYWSDGTRVRAQDFVYAWCEKLLNPNNPTPAAALLYDIENALMVKSGQSGTAADIGVSATETYQLTIKYREGGDYQQLLRNLASVATAPIAQAHVSKTPTYWTKFANTLCSNGPFMASKYSTLTHELLLTRNKGYHQDPGTLDYDNQVIPGALLGFVTASGETIETTYADIENKVVFYLLDAPVADRTANASKLTLKDDTSVYSYVFNTEKPLFANAKVRQALSLAIDRAAIVAAIASGKAADGFLPNVSGGSTEAIIASGANKAEAEAILADVDFSGISSKSFKLSVADNEESRIIAEIVETAWEDLGFDVTIDYVEPVQTKFPGETSDAPDIEILDSGIQVLLKEASFGNRDFDVVALDWQTYSNDPFVALSAFATTFSGCGYGRTSITGWSDSQYDYLITEAYRTTGAERQNALKAAEKYLCEAAPIVPIVFNQNAAFVSSELSGIRYDGFGNAIFTYVSQRNYHNYLDEE